MIIARTNSFLLVLFSGALNRKVTHFLRTNDAMQRGVKRLRQRSQFRLSLSFVLSLSKSLCLKGAKKRLALVCSIAERVYLRESV